MAETVDIDKVKSQLDESGRLVLENLLTQAEKGNKVDKFEKMPIMWRITRVIAKWAMQNPAKATAVVTTFVTSFGFVTGHSQIAVSKGVEVVSSPFDTQKEFMATLQVIQSEVRENKKFRTEHEPLFAHEGADNAINKLTEIQKQLMDWQHDSEKWQKKLSKDFLLTTSTLASDNRHLKEQMQYLRDDYRELRREVTRP